MILSRVCCRWSSSFNDIGLADSLLGPTSSIRSTDEELPPFLASKISKPWIQEWHIGLKSFFLSSEQSIHFFIVNPNTYVLHEMTAKKKTDFELEIFPNIAFRQTFWKGFASYDQNGILQKYKVNQMGQNRLRW